MDPAYPAVVYQVKKNNLCFNVQKSLLAEKIFSVYFFFFKVFYKNSKTNRKQKFERKTVAESFLFYPHFFCLNVLATSLGPS